MTSSLSHRRALPAPPEPRRRGAPPPASLPSCSGGRIWCRTPLADLKTAVCALVLCSGAHGGGAAQGGGKGRAGALELLCTGASKLMDVLLPASLSIAGVVISVLCVRGNALWPTAPMPPPALRSCSPPTALTHAMASGVVCLVTAQTSSASRCEWMRRRQRQP
ncbi:unnamed protein product [Urochloa humidicola]